MDLSALLKSFEMRNISAPQIHACSHSKDHESFFVHVNPELLAGCSLHVVTEQTFDQEVFSIHSC